MPKTAPSLGRILTMVLFALSCFGLLLFLWLSFGGSVPLRPEAYRFKATFPEAATLAQEADVRIAGVNVGKVKKKELDKGAVRTLVEMEIQEKYAPIPRDTRAMLRQKTLLGETFIELTPGRRESGALPEGAKLAGQQTEPTVELDEILRIFDRPTKRAFKVFVQEQGRALKGGTSEDLNDALGSLPGFAEDGADTLRILDEQKVALKQLIKNTGVVFGALNEREGELAELIQNANNVFEATASEKESLAETFEIFPTFLDESRFTVQRLETFSRDTHPLTGDLKPVADDLGPTVRDLGALAPDLERFFADLRPAIRERDNLRAAARFLLGARPVFKGLNTFLPELNPILAYLNFQQPNVADFFTIGGAAINGTVIGNGPNDPRNYLKQFGIINGRTFAFNQDRPAYDRGIAYLEPNADARGDRFGVFESFDCNQPGGPRRDAEDPGAPGGNDAMLPCFVKPPSLFDGGRFSRLSRGEVPPLRPGIEDPPNGAPPRCNDMRAGGPFHDCLAGTRPASP